MTLPNKKRTGSERVIIKVEQFLAIEWNEPFEDSVTDSAAASAERETRNIPCGSPSSSNRSDHFAFQIEGIPGNLRHLPVASFNHLKWD